MPWYLRWPLKALSIVATSPSDCAKTLLDGFLSDSRKTGWHLMDHHGKNVNPTSGHNDAIREKVFEWTNSVISPL
jgi:hypothetical protein